MTGLAFITKKKKNLFHQIKVEHLHDDKKVYC